MSFRKRKPFPSSPSVGVTDVTENPEGRSLFRSSLGDYAKRHAIPDEEFSLTEQLQSGVPIQEIPCGNLLNKSDPLDVNVDAQQILANIQEKPIE